MSRVRPDPHVDHDPCLHGGLTWASEKTSTATQQPSVAPRHSSHTSPSTQVRRSFPHVLRGLCRSCHSASSSCGGGVRSTSPASGHTGRGSRTDPGRQGGARGPGPALQPHSLLTDLRDGAWGSPVTWTVPRGAHLEPRAEGVVLQAGGPPLGHLVVPGAEDGECMHAGGAAHAVALPKGAGHAEGRRRRQRG